MFNLGGPEIIIVAIVVIWFFGADKLKEFAKYLGESTKEIKEFKNEIEKVNEPSDPKE
jgi:TatA/E family protein of Tat protein translocase